MNEGWVKDRANREADAWTGIQDLKDGWMDDSMGGWIIDE